MNRTERRGPARIGIGMFLYNEERHVAEAISSLLAQTLPEFDLVVVDDCSTDGTASIVRRFADEDSRIQFFRNDRRMGYGANYLRTFAHSKPAHVYWAWAAGHDRHDPRWLHRMVEALDANPASVLAYPLTVRISETGARYPEHPPLRFQTRGMDLRARIAALRSGNYRMGDMIYGLFRVDALKEAGVFPQFLLPDVFLIWKLARSGSFVQVNEELWFRRFVGLFSVQRQRRVMFSSAPWYTYLPWPMVNSIALFVATVLRPTGRHDRRGGARLTAAYFLRYWPYLILSSPRLARLAERPIQFLLARRARRRNA